MRPAPSSPTTAFCQLSGSSGAPSRNKKSTSSGTSPSTATRSWMAGARRAKVTPSKRPGSQAGGAVAGAPVSGSRHPPGDHAPGTGSTQGRTASMNPSVGQLADVDPVHVGQLLHVEEGRRALDVLEGEALEDRLDRHDLLVAGAPAQKGQVVAEGIGQVPLLPVHLDGDRVTALGELLALLVDQQRQVGVGRQRQVDSPPRHSSAPHSMIWRGVVGSWSSPRITWEMAMVRSSTALAKTKSALPLPFTQMKSSSARWGNSTSPRTRSCTSTTPSSGVRKRSALPSPRGSPRSRQYPS